LIAVSMMLRFRGPDQVTIVEVGRVRWSEATRSRFAATRRVFDRFSARFGADSGRMMAGVSAVRSGRAGIVQRASLSRWMNFRGIAQIDASPAMIVEDLRGWPWPALRCEWDGRSTTTGGGRDWSGGRPYADWSSPTPSIWDARAVPLDPVWPGLLADVGLFGGLWMLALGGWRAARRVTRHTLGRCAACGYSLKGSGGPDAGCPECGWRRSDRSHARSSISPPPRTTPD
jgi:hypothetical protein